MQRSFSYFPPRGPGIALLAVRVTLGYVSIGEAIVYQDSWYGDGWIARLIAFVILLDGTVLVFGFMTPIAALVAASASTFALLGAALPLPWLIDSRTAATEALVMSVALLALGPGAYSVDARLFGRKRLLIPRTPPDDVP